MTSTSYTHCKRRDPVLKSIVTELARRRPHDVPGMSHSSSASSIGLESRKYVPLNLDSKYITMKNEIEREGNKKAQAEAILRLATTLKKKAEEPDTKKVSSSQDTKNKGRQMMNTKIDSSKANDVRNRQKQYSRQIDKAAGKSIELQIDTITRAVVQNFRKLINTERCALFLMDHNTNELYFKPVGGLDADVPEIRFPATAGIAGWVATHVKELNIPDAYIDDRFNPEIDKKTGFRTRNILCMPVMDQETGKLLAVCQMVNKFEKQKVDGGEADAKDKKKKKTKDKQYVSFGSEDEATLRRCCMRVAEALHVLRELQRKESEQQSLAIKQKRKAGVHNRRSAREDVSSRLAGTDLVRSRRGSKSHAEMSDELNLGPRTHRSSSRRLSRGDIMDLNLDDVASPSASTSRRGSVDLSNVSRRGSADFTNGSRRGSTDFTNAPVSSRRGSVSAEDGGGGMRSRRNSFGINAESSIGQTPDPRGRRLSKGNVLDGLDVENSPSRHGSRSGSRRGSFSGAGDGEGLSVNNQAKNEVINFINFMSIETAKLEAEQRAREKALEGDVYGNGASTAAEAFSKFNFREASGPQMTGKGQTLDSQEKRDAVNKMKRQKAYTKQMQEAGNDNERLMNAALRGIISKFKQLLECERCGLFFVDDDTDELYFQVEEEGAEIRFPKHLGIAGSVCMSGEGILIPDAYKDSRFNQSVDKQTGFRTRNILCQPIKNIIGDVIAVVQMVNCNKEGGFGKKDIDTLASCATKVARGLEAIKDTSADKLKSATLMESRMQSVETINEVIREINKEIEKDKRAYLARRKEESRHEYSANEAAARFTFRDRKEDKSKFIGNIVEEKIPEVEENTQNYQDNHKKFREIFGE